MSQGVKASIEDQARRLGFTWFGVTSPDPPPHFDVFESWLKAGRHAGMGYLESERSRLRRADPKRILPECQSILMLGAPYPSPVSIPSHDAPGQLRGRVAAYAWGVDYHEVFPERLRQLAAYIEAQAGQSVLNRWYTDTGPLLERDLAQRAGLGWIGKNTCLIHPRMGSYFLLAAILLDYALPPDPPFTPDHCGNCTRCLEACPTGCILPDRTIDSRRCIAYLTIELKGAIPVDLRPEIGNWIFGCDLCQQVCPWNQRFAQTTGDPAFAPHPETAHPDLLAELALTPEAFTRKFKGSPVKRAKRRGYLRNVAVALGNSRDPLAIPALQEALLHDPEPLVRGHAAWAIGNTGGRAAYQALDRATQAESDTYVLEEIHSAARIQN